MKLLLDYFMQIKPLQPQLADVLLLSVAITSSSVASHKSSRE